MKGWHDATLFIFHPSPPTRSLSHGRGWGYTVRMQYHALVSTLGVFAAVVVVSAIAVWPPIAALFAGGGMGVVLAVVLVIVVSYVLARKEPPGLPVVLWALLFGMALQGPLAALTAAGATLTIIVHLLVAYVLFASGLLVPVKGFKRHFAPIAALSLAGTLATIGVFAIVLTLLTGYVGIAVPALSLIVLAAILASIDPSAITEPLELLGRKHAFLRDMALAEGALNDAVGVIIARFVLVVALGLGSAYAAVPLASGLSLVLSAGMIEQIAFEVFWGILIGLLGYAILKVWGETVRGQVHWSDPALFAIVPIFTFALGSIVGGAGFVAAFVAGLLYESHASTHEVRDRFDRSVNHLVKPALFVLLGALAPLETLIDLLPLGCAAALVFMFVIRPLVVFVTLVPWYRGHGRYVSWRDVLLLSSVRETGALSAALLVLALTMGLLGGAFVYAIGVWVIVFTLIVEPPLTAALVDKLKLTK